MNITDAAATQEREIPKNMNGQATTQIINHLIELEKNENCHYCQINLPNKFSQSI